MFPIGSSLEVAELKLTVAAPATPPPSRRSTSEPHARRACCTTPPGRFQCSRPCELGAARGTRWPATSALATSTLYLCSANLQQQRQQQSGRRVCALMTSSSVFGAAAQTHALSLSPSFSLSAGSRLDAAPTTSLSRSFQLDSRRFLSSASSSQLSTLNSQLSSRLVSSSSFIRNLHSSPIFLSLCPPSSVPSLLPSIWIVIAHNLQITGQNQPASTTESSVHLEKLRATCTPNH